MKCPITLAYWSFTTSDRTQVNELFTNLISNGIKYNQKTEKIIEIGYLDAENSVFIEKIGEYPDNAQPKTIFYVRDNGIGIRERLEIINVELDQIITVFRKVLVRDKNHPTIVM